MSQREVNLQILSDPKSSRYIHELKRSPNIIAPHQLQQYYTILCRHINLNENTEEVFRVLCKSLMINDNNLDYFISNNFIDNFSTFEQPILNLINILVSKSSKSIRPKAIFIISKMISSFPREVLHIIAIYTKKVKEELQQNKSLNEKSDIDIDPWKIFEIAIQNFNLYLSFFEDEETNYIIVVDYITLLGHIFEVSIDNNMLTEERLENIWSTCCSMLSSHDSNVVIASYSLLSFIADKISSILKSNPEHFSISSFPMDIVLSHLSQKKEFTKYAISFMLHFPPPKVNDTLLNNIIDIASGLTNDDEIKKETSQDGNPKEKKIKSISAKAKLILMQIANDEQNCQSLLLLNSKWMTMDGLPAFIDILTLFMVCLSQKEFRDLFIEETNKELKDNPNPILDNVSIFFNNILKKIPSDDILQIICTIIKRIPLSEKIMNKLSESGFFSEFFNRSLDSKNIVNIQVGLIVLHYLYKVCYIKEFDLVLEKLVQFVGSGEKLSTMAATSCIELCKYEQCLETLKKLDFAGALNQNPENHKLQQFLKKFKKILKNSTNS